MLAQTPDGWLWLGGPNGLYRFDGVQFEPVTLEGRDPNLSSAIISLFAEESGDLWVGYIYGGVSRIGHGTMSHYGMAEGLPESSVNALERDAQGTLLVATVRGLLRFDGTRWHSIDAETGFVDGNATGIFLDAHSTLWVSGTKSIYRMRKGGERFEPMLKTVGNIEFFQSLDGRGWYRDETGAHVLPDQSPGKGRPLNANARLPRGALIDREGHYWTTDVGVQRFPLPADASELLYKDSVASNFTLKDGLTSNRAHTVLEDMEGNIWIATAGGVDRFRPTNVHKITLHIGEHERTSDIDSYPMGLAAANEGAVWIGINPGSYGVASTQDGLWKFDGHATHVAFDVIKQVSATERDANGFVWIGGRGGVWRQEHGDQFRRLPDLPANALGQEIQAIAVDGAGDPWVSVVRALLYRFHGGTWQVNGNLPDLPQSRANAHAHDPAGRVWLGYQDGRVALVDGSRVTWYGTREGLQVGLIRAIHIDRFTVVAGQRGLAILDEGRFHILNATAEASALTGVGGITEARDGDLWVNGARGAARIAQSELQEALRTKTYAVTPELFDSQDGFPGISLVIRPLPTLIRGTDDRLWFAGTLGSGWLDPQHLRRNAIQPPVAIRSVISDGVTNQGAEKVELRQGAQNLQVNYTALSLSRPEQVRFRYRLAGFDKAWVEAGSRRNAFYTNLPPGTYQFQVIAANESGLWNTAGASMSIGIPPTFTQTRGFLLLCALAGIALLWGAYFVRIRQVTARERVRLEERLGERERIARELHDTILQGVQGLIFKMQGVVDESDMREQSRQAMNEELDRADALLGEGRDRVQGLRGGATSTSFRAQLLAAAEQVSSAENRPQIRVIENGAPRDLHPVAREETIRVATEATLNSVRHAAAKTIEIEVSYDRSSLRLSVRDDGRGMEEAVIRSGREGHYGFVGMRERAKHIGGQLGIWSRPGAGTEVSLTVPARMAYVRRRWSWW
jgi:signal transduction histidine kinase/ligand-binding sensor domain-containing protein